METEAERANRYAEGLRAITAAANQFRVTFADCVKALTEFKRSVPTYRCTRCGQQPFLEDLMLVSGDLRHPDDALSTCGPVEQYVPGEGG